MSIPARRGLAVVLASLCCLLLGLTQAHAQTDEIQVYTGEINKPGQLSITLHNNFTVDGRTQGAYPGAVVPDHSLNGVPEFGYGMTEWWEIGAYVPDYTYTRDGRLEADSVKLRTLFVVPHAEERSFFYGVNFEFSYNQPWWDQHRYTGEIRPIVGWRFGPVDLVLNPIVDYDFSGPRSATFEPAVRLAWNTSPLWAFAVEHYADFGRINRFANPDMQGQSTFLVVDYNGEPVNVEFGVGHGFTAGSDNLVVKLMLTHAF
jgi:hypothetical protein